MTMVGTWVNAAGDRTDWRQQVRTARREARSGIRVEDVRLQPVGDEQWRVVNAAIEPTDVYALLGFVERVDGLFDVTFLSEPSTIYRFTNRTDARQAFASPDPTDGPAGRVVVEDGTFGPEAVPSWLHRLAP